MEKKKLLFENGAEALFGTDDEACVVLSRKDGFTLPGGESADAFPGKGALCGRMSNHLHRMLSSKGIGTSFLEELSDADCSARRTEAFPFRIVVRNYSAGHFMERTGLKEGAALVHPAAEFRMERTGGTDVMVNGYDLLALKRASEEELQTIVKTAFRVNEILKPYFLGLDINLIDLSLHFGRMKEAIVLTGTLSPDCMRLWDTKTSQRLDKDRFRKGLGNVEDAYREMFGRLKIGE